MPKLTEPAKKAKPKTPSASGNRLWTNYPKIMGNVIPALIAFPFAIYGLFFMATTGVVMGRGLWFFAGSPLVLWLAMNFLGLYRNGAMRKLLGARLMSTHPELAAMWEAANGPGFKVRNREPQAKAQNPKSKVPQQSKVQISVWFVGVATPKYSSLLDPHEDIGFLLLSADKLEFFGDHLNLSVQKNDVSGIQFRMNPHTLVGLGRWVSVEGQSGGQRIRLQIEPRDRGTLLGNLLQGRNLKRRLTAWLRAG